MTVRKRKVTLRFFWIIPAVLLLAFFALFAYAHVKAEQAVKDFLTRKIPSHIVLDYDMLQVNVTTGTLRITDIDLKFHDRDSMRLNTRVAMDVLTLEGFGYYKFFAANTIHADALRFMAPSVTSYLSDQEVPQDSTPKGVVELLKTIEVGQVEVENGSYTILKATGDTLLRMEGVHVLVDDSRTDPDLIKERIPVQYGRYDLAAENLFVDLGPYELLRAQFVEFKDSNVVIDSLVIQSKYDKAQLSKEVPYERDHIDLKVSEMQVDNIVYGFRGETFFVASDSIMIHRPVLDMFRDKLVPDDTRRKKLYSAMFRELPIHVSVPLVKVVDGSIAYGERVNYQVAPGEIDFDSLHVEIHNLDNRPNNDEETNIKASARLMGTAAMTLDWSFDISDTDDRFLAAGSVSDFNPERMDAFLIHNLRAEAKGMIHKLYFTISGGAMTSSGDLKMRYDDFHLQVLDKDRDHINKFLTAIGNIFVNDGSRTDADGFRHGQIEVQRDPTKSFFNYLWLNVREGIRHSMTGSGKKK